MLPGPSGTQRSTSNSDLPLPIHFGYPARPKWHTTSVSLRSGPPSAGTVKTPPPLSSQRPKAEGDLTSVWRPVRAADVTTAGVGEPERTFPANQLHV